LKLDRVKLNRKYNLGNYETLDVCFEAETTEQDNPLDVLKGLEDMAELYLQTRLSKTEQKPEPKPQPKPTQKSVLDEFPPDYRSHLTLKDDKIYCEFVERNIWTEINQIARSIGFEYVAGKGAHWEARNNG